MNDLTTEFKIGVTPRNDSLLVVDHDVANTFCRGVHYDSTGVIMGMFNFKLASADRQFGLFRFDWNDSLESVETFGDPLTREEMFDFKKGKDATYLVGSSPQGPVLFPLNRQILLYRMDTMNYDSVLIFGNKNHQAESILEGIDGSLFIVSPFTEFSIDSTVKINIIKFDPSIISSTKRINKNQTSLIVYPNPTSDLIYSDSFVEGNLYEIYSIDGRVVKKGRIQSNGSIRVSDLTNGSYVLVIRSNEVLDQRSWQFFKAP